MFSGFNVKVNEDTIAYDHFYESGKYILQSNRTAVQKNLREYICDRDSLDGSLMSSDWFPEINAVIFLSHSHVDEKLVVSFAGWLHELFGLRAFVDSMVWGYSNDLLKIIDDVYCLKTSGSYSYEKRNYSTSHVHMMLSMALTKMIDKCESVFFINTSNSVSVSEGIVKTNYTFSPWIYAEIETTRMIRHKKLYEYRNIPEIVNESIAHFDTKREDLRVRYDVSLDHLIELTDNDLLEWQKSGRKQICNIPMDKLYTIKKIWEK